MTKSLILLTNFFKNMALFACFNGLYVLPYMYMKKYNVTFTVYFDTDIKNVDTAVMADNEDEAMDKADKIDGGEWTELHEGSWDWNPIRAEEVKE